MAALRTLVEYVLYRVIALVVPLLPRIVVVCIGRGLGGVYYWLSPRTRRTGRENLMRFLPERRKDHGWIARESVRTNAVALLDALWSVRFSVRWVRKCVTVEAGPGVEDVVASGRGAVFATAHFGSWELVNLASRAYGLARMTFIARPINNKWIDRHLRHRRERTGNRLVYRDGAVRACHRALRANENIGSVIDMAIAPWDGGQFLDFMGTPACTSTTLPALAVLNKAPILFVVCRPRRWGLRYVVEVELVPEQEATDRRDEMTRLAGELNKRLERKIRAHPECWMWTYKRWKWRPIKPREGYPSYAVWAFRHGPHGPSAGRPPGAGIA